MIKDKDKNKQMNREREREREREYKKKRADDRDGCIKHYIINTSILVLQLLLFELVNSDNQNIYTK